MKFVICLSCQLHFLFNYHISNLKVLLSIAGLLLLDDDAQSEASSLPSLRNDHGLVVAPSRVKRADVII